MKKAILLVPYLRGTGGTETVIHNFMESYTAESAEERDTEMNWKLISFGGTEFSGWFENWNKLVFSFSKNRLIQRVCYIVIMPLLLIRVLLTEKPNVVISTNPFIWFLVCVNKFLFFRFRTIKVVGWYHYSLDKKNVRSFLLRLPDQMWAISTGIRNELIERGVPAEKIEVVYNPINTKKADLVSRSGAQNRIVYIGRIDFDGQKNLEELFKALNELDTNWKCDLFGSVDENVSGRLLNLLDSSKKTQRVNFHGFSENVWDKVEVADVLVLTSKYEGFPMVLCEAAARGIALISSNCPTGPDDIVTTNNGLLYSSGEIGELSQSLSKITANRSVLPRRADVVETMANFSYSSFYKKITRAMFKLLE